MHKSTNILKSKINVQQLGSNFHGKMGKQKYQSGKISMLDNKYVIADK